MKISQYLTENIFLWFCLGILVLIQIAWTFAVVASASISQYTNSNGIQLNQVVNQSVLTEWLWRNNFTGIVIMVTMYSQLNPNSVNSALISLYTNVTVFFSWLGMSIIYHYTSLSNTQSYHMLVCSDPNVPSNLCSSMLANAWLDAFNIIWTAATCCFSIYQVVRAIRYNGPGVNDRMGIIGIVNLSLVTLMVAGYIVWTVADIKLQASKTSTFTTLNTGWVDVYQSSFALHVIVVACVATGVYSARVILNRYIAFCIQIIQWVLAFNILPVFVYMATAQYGNYYGVCVSGTSSTYECGSRQAVVWGMFIVLFSSWILASTTTWQWLTAPNETVHYKREPDDQLTGINHAPAY